MPVQNPFPLTKADITLFVADTRAANTASASNDPVSCDAEITCKMAANI
jgi:hypothetical protein